MVAQPNSQNLPCMAAALDDLPVLAARLRVAGGMVAGGEHRCIFM
jgi:hypothetical protein